MPIRSGMDRQSEWVSAIVATADAASAVRDAGNTRQGKMPDERKQKMKSGDG